VWGPAASLGATPPHALLARLLLLLLLLLVMRLLLLPLLMPVMLLPQQQKVMCHRSRRWVSCGFLAVPVLACCTVIKNFLAATHA
jgi:Na+-driven multidrug efflux pump